MAVVFDSKSVRNQPVVSFAISLESEMARADSRKTAVPYGTLMTLKNLVSTNVKSHLT